MPSTDQESKKCFCSLNLKYILSANFAIRVLEAIMSWVCLNLLTKYGYRNIDSLGKAAYYEVMDAVSICFIMTSILLPLQIFSSKNEKLIRKTLFELVFNIVACWIYLLGSLHMSKGLWGMLPQYFNPFNRGRSGDILKILQLCGAGAAAGALHGIDAFLSFGRMFKD